MTERGQEQPHLASRRKSGEFQSWHSTSSRRDTYHRIPERCGDGLCIRAFCRHYPRPQKAEVTMRDPTLWGGSKVWDTNASSYVATMRQRIRHDSERREPLRDCQEGVCGGILSWPWPTISGSTRHLSKTPENCLFLDCRQPHDDQKGDFPVAPLKAWTLEMWSTPWQIAFQNAKGVVCLAWLESPYETWKATRVF